MILSDVATIYDCPHSTAPDEGEGYPLIRTPNIGKGRLILDDVHRVSKEVYDIRNKRAIPQENDIIFAREAPAGNAALITKGQKVCLGQRTVLIRPKQDLVDPHYLVYYLLAPQQQIKLLGFSHGATVGHVNIPDITKLSITLPSLTIQKSIARIVEHYDNLTEVNNKRIKVLEQMAENLYKEWFVRFRFPGHESVPFENGLPQGWRKAKLKDIAIEVEKPIKAERRTEYQHYLPIDTLPSRRMALLEEDEIDNAESSLLAFEEGDILIGAMRPYFHKVILAPFKGLTRSTCFVVNSINPKYRLYLYLLLFQDSSINYATTVSVGSTMPYARWKDFSRLNIIFPAISVIERFNHYVEPIMTQIIESYSTYCNLSRQRDMLLPRLMSGKLEV